MGLTSIALTTSTPWSSKALTRWPPMKPPAPQTATFSFLRFMDQGAPCVSKMQVTDTTLNATKVAGPRGEGVRLQTFGRLPSESGRRIPLLGCHKDGQGLRPVQHRSGIASLIYWEKQLDSSGFPVFRPGQARHNFATHLGLNTGEGSSYRTGEHASACQNQFPFVSLGPDTSDLLPQFVSRRWATRSPA